MIGERRAQVLKGRGDGIDQIDGFGLELDRPGLDPRHVEQVGDVALELVGFALRSLRSAPDPSPWPGEVQRPRR